MNTFARSLVLVIVAVAISSCGLGLPGPFICEARCKDTYGATIIELGFETEGLDETTACEIDELKAALTCSDCRDAIVERYRIAPFCEFCPLDACEPPYIEDPQ